jgi:predicted MFS family arabinose efflux permease
MTGDATPDPVGRETAHATAEDGQRAPPTLNREFRLLWGGHIISNFGSYVGSVAIPLLAIGALGATPFQMGVLVALQSVPTVLLAVGAGLLADRVQRRTIMLAADAGRALLIAVTGLLAATGQLRIEHLYGIVLCASSLGVLFDVSFVATIPAVAARDQLLKANTLIQGGQAVSALVGRSVGGLLVSTLAVAGALYVDSVTFALSFLALWLMRPTVQSSSMIARPGVWADLKEGFSYAYGQEYLRGLLGYAATSNFCVGAFFAVYVVYLANDLRVSAGAIGFVLAALGAGSLIGTLVAPFATRASSVGAVTTTAAFVAPAAAWLLVMSEASMTHTVIRQILCLGVLGAALTIININIGGVTQAATPARLMARVAGISQFLCAITLPIGALAGGLTAEWGGPAAAIRWSAAGLCATALWLMLSPVYRLRSLAAVDCPPEPAA